ncbi:MAG: DegT/DnrJ/EryC1/StrS family aminotransferase [Patescibacteria group bacterium]
MINVSKPVIEQDEIDVVVEVLKSGMIVQGPKTAELEEKFAKYCGTKYAVAFNSGTAAIHAGLYAMGIGEEDEVITTPFTFVATANPILMQGAKVVFADISEDDFNLDPAEVEKKITDTTKAIIPVDLYGQVYDYEKISKIAEKHSLKILEDACQAVGAEQNDKRAGNFGDVAAFSLYATKNMMSGEGGLITTNDEKLAEKCKMFRHHGQSETLRYEYVDLGYNYRLTDMAAAIALVQLGKIDEFNKRRNANATRLEEGLKNIKGLILPKRKEGNFHVYHQFTIRITKDFALSRDELIEEMKNRGVGAGVYYPKPLHLHSHFQKLGYKEGDFPIAEKMSKEVVSLPVHPSLANEEVEKIIKAIKDIANGN